MDEATQLLEQLECGSTDRWEDLRPKRWPTMQLRVRGRRFDIYCGHVTDVTLDARGLPVVAGLTVDADDLRRGWADVNLIT
ncbi:MAG: hypothetical protein ACR2NR_10265 [Solirubrobacteraceae bacterium]